MHAKLRSSLSQSVSQSVSHYGKKASSTQGQMRHVHAVQLTVGRSIHDRRQRPSHMIIITIELVRLSFRLSVCQTLHYYTG